MCKSCRICFKFYCMFYFTCDRSFMLQKHVQSKLPSFLPARYSSIRHYASAGSLLLQQRCLSVCSSICHTLVLHQNEQSFFLRQIKSQHMFDVGSRLKMTDTDRKRATTACTATTLLKIFVGAPSGHHGQDAHCVEGFCRALVAAAAGILQRRRL